MLLGLLGAVVAALVAWEVGIILGGSPDGLIVWLPSIPHLVIGGIGAFLILRTDARRLGWLLALSTLFLFQFVTSSEWVATGSTWAGVGEGLGGLPLAFLTAAVILYPTGRAESRVLAVLVVVEVVAISVTCIHWVGVNVGWWEQVADPLELAVAGSALPMVGSLVEQIRIYRRRSALQQKQVKWYVLGLFAFPLYVVPGLLGWSDNAFVVVDLFVTMLFPIAILIGITRYRLYEIDRLVSRTVGYVLVIGMLAGVAVGTVALLTALLPAQDQFVTAAVTVLVVALSRPLRRRVLDAVDRRFDRTKYVAQQVVDDFGRGIQDQTDLEAVRESVHTVVGTTLAPRTVAVWEPASARPTATA